MQPERFTDQTSDPVPHYRVSNLSPDSDSNSSQITLVFMHKERKMGCVRTSDPSRVPEIPPFESFTFGKREETHEDELSILTTEV